MNSSQILVRYFCHRIDYISFKIDYRVQQNVLNAIEHWHERTCIRFEPYDPQRHQDIGAKIIIEDTGSGFVDYTEFFLI
jgi:hypothetical protein